ncbi:uncharacterized protein PHALS_03428 [Plasmopara halstedii]|uniref:Uncharacterized protein n=1 Tax=Plasmopara halstedii TaxID=4781 RepID=A0A0P1AWH2_PLAHL|nr:uncharacterized protein PHALS_03428 [Plasmopara halstedii]CEG46744.1 hypothetical protein PHALS_03428 [Plasmopara halstedii]|eukprot:XP_024583113.1 hypothetical protein PHALS_03428 [Plasmopara halstedii]
MEHYLVLAGLHTFLPVGYGESYAHLWQEKKKNKKQLWRVFEGLLAFVYDTGVTDTLES